MLSREEVQHIAHLARITLKEEEIEKFQGELSIILDYMDKLKKVDTKNVTPLTGATFLYNRMRQDIAVQNPEIAGKLFKEVPKKLEGFIEVKAVL